MVFLFWHLAVLAQDNATRKLT